MEMAYIQFGMFPFVKKKTKARSPVHSARYVLEKTILSVLILPLSMTGVCELDPLTGDVGDFSIPLKALSYFLPLTVSKEDLKNEKQTKEHFPKAGLHAGEGVVVCHFSWTCFKSVEGA